MAGAGRFLAGAPATNGGMCKIRRCAAMKVRKLAARTGLTVATAARAIGRRSPRAPAPNRYARAGTRGLPSLGRAVPAAAVPTPGS